MFFKSVRFHGILFIGESIHLTKTALFLRYQPTGQLVLRRLEQILFLEPVLTYQNYILHLANSALDVKIHSDSYEPTGLTASARISGKTVTITITGTTAQELNLASTYSRVATITELAEYLSSSIAKYAIFNSSYYGQINILTSGSVQIGYLRNISDGLPAVLPSGTNVYIRETFVMA